MLKKVLVRLFSLVPVAKPEKKALQINEAFTTGQLKKILPEGYRWDVSSKMDGIRCQVHKSGGRIVLMSDEARALPDKRLSPLIAELRRYLPTTVILDGELMYYRGGINTGHQGIVSYLHRKGIGKKEVEGVRYYAFDCLYYGGRTLTSLPLYARVSYLRKLNEGAYFKKVKRTMVEKSGIEKVVPSVRSDEGVIVRADRSDYWQTNLMFKLKESWDFDARVVSVERTKNGAEVYVMEDAEGNIVGKTYAQSFLHAKKGQIIRVTVTEVSRRKDLKTGRFIYHWYNPRLIQEKQATGGLKGKLGKVVGRKNDRRIDGQLLLERIYQATRGKSGGGEKVQDGKI